MSDYQLEDDIEIPKMRRSGGTKYPLADMEVGQSFFAEKTGVLGAINTFHKETDMRFVTRTVEENGVTGLRVWRKS